MAEEKPDSPQQAPNFTTDEVSDAGTESPSIAPDKTSDAGTESPSVAPDLGAPLPEPDERAAETVDIADEMTKTAIKGSSYNH